MTEAPVFRFAETGGPDKEVYTFYGYKGVGKTAGALSFGGKRVVLCFDGKTYRVKKLLYAGDPSIIIINAAEHYTHDKEKMTEAGSNSHAFVMFCLAEVAKLGDVDWVIFDGLEVFIEMAEMKMRYDNKLGPFQAFPNRSLWKDRRVNVRVAHEAALKAARLGIVYTTYTEQVELVEAGLTVCKKDIPKWIDIIMQETDVVLHCDTMDIDGETHFVANVVTSKLPKFVTGSLVDLTMTPVKKHIPVGTKAKSRPAATTSGTSMEKAKSGEAL